MSHHFCHPRLSSHISGRVKDIVQAAGNQPLVPLKMILSVVVVVSALAVWGQSGSDNVAEAQGRNYTTIKKAHTLVVIECLRGIRRRYTIKKDEDTGEWVYRKYRKKRVSRIARLLCS